MDGGQFDRQVACRDRPRVCPIPAPIPAPIRSTDRKIYFCIWIRSCEPEGFGQQITPRGLSLHAAYRSSWHGVGRDNDKNPFHKVQNGRDDGNIGFVDMQNHPYINNTLSYAVDSSMTDSVGRFYAVDFIMTDGVGHFYAVDSTMTDGVGHFYAVDSSMTDGVGHFYAVDFTMTYGIGCFYAVDSIATMVLVVSTP